MPLEEAEAPQFQVPARRLAAAAVRIRSALGSATPQEPEERFFLSTPPDGTPQRTARPLPIRRTGTAGDRRPDQGEVRRVQRHSARWCRSIPVRSSRRSNSSPKPASKYSRITHADRRSLPRPAGRIDPDRAHSRQADGRHRSAEHASAKSSACARFSNRTSSAIRRRR